MTWLGFLVQKKMASCVFKPDSIALIKTAKNKKSWLVYVAGSRHCRRKPGDKGINAGHRKSSPMQMWSNATATDITSKASFYWWMVICFHDCVALLFQWQHFQECSYCVSVALRCVAFCCPPERYTKCGPEHEVIEVGLILCLYSILIYLTRLMFKKKIHSFWNRYGNPSLSIEVL